MRSDHQNLDQKSSRTQCWSPHESMINQGIMQASAGGILELAGRLPPVVTDNSGGTIQAFENSSVDLVHFVSIEGGSLQGIVGGMIRVPSFNTATITDAMVSNVHVENNSNLIHAGTISNGSLFINGDVSGQSRVLVHGETTLTGNSTVTMSGLGARLIDFSANAGI